MDIESAKIPEVTIDTKYRSRPTISIILSNVRENAAKFNNSQYSRTKKLMQKGSDNILSKCEICLTIIGDTLLALLTTAGLAFVIWSILWIAGIIGFIIVCGFDNSIGAWLYGPFLSGIVMFLLCSHLCIVCCGNHATR